MDKNGWVSLNPLRLAEAQDQLAYSSSRATFSKGFPPISFFLLIGYIKTKQQNCPWRLLPWSPLGVGLFSQVDAENFQSNQKYFWLCLRLWPTSRDHPVQPNLWTTPINPKMFPRFTRKTQTIENNPLYVCLVSMGTVVCLRDTAHVLGYQRTRRKNTQSLRWTRKKSLQSRCLRL